MKNYRAILTNNTAFTLIELLVAVVIIGILAAIALPQYKKVVFKNKMIGRIQNIRAAYNHARVYSLTHGDFPNDMTALDIDLGSCAFEEENRKCVMGTHVCFLIQSLLGRLLQGIFRQESSGFFSSAPHRVLLLGQIGIRMVLRSFRRKTLCGFAAYAAGRNFLLYFRLLNNILSARQQLLLKDAACFLV
jgi:prepilin-type N-terminal cleavage/methylation domain-containing protein